jgi:DNA polymerase-1
LLLATLQERKYELSESVHHKFKPICKKGREVTPKVKRDGTLSAVGLKYYGANWHDIVGVHTRIDFPDFNLGSRQQIGVYLQRFGWTPEAFTDTGQPIVSETVLNAVEGIPEASLIADYLTVQKRIAMAQSWLDFVQSDGRVHGNVDPLGCVTGRMSHDSPNMGQVTAGTKIYGNEMRECWVVREGYSLVGMDASGLELRMLAHYMNDSRYTEEVLNGDVHTANQQAAGLNDRNQAKTFIYAFLYGAGDAKIGSIVGGGKSAGKALKAKFLKGLPALKNLKERVERASRKGVLRGLDGRQISVRSSHAALNSLLQGAGAVVMKQALVILDRMAKAQNIDYKLVGNIHDEIQAEVRNDHAEKFGRLAAYAMAKAGLDFDLRIPLVGNYKIGDNWQETH